MVGRVYFSNRSHDTLYPLAGPIFQETKAGDGSGNYLYLINPESYEVSRIGPYSGILGPYAVDSTSSHVVNNVTNLWGMQVADLRTGQIITADIPDHPPGDAGLLHGIGWTPDQSEVWESGTACDPHVYIWDMRNPMAPVLKERLALRSGRGSHWLTFDIKGDHGYVAPNKSSADGTEIFDTHTHTSVGDDRIIGRHGRNRLRRRKDQSSRRSVWDRATIDLLNNPFIAHAAFDMIIVADAANMPPTPWRTSRAAQAGQNGRGGKYNLPQALQRCRRNSPSRVPSQQCCISGVGCGRARRPSDIRSIRASKAAL